MKIYFTHGTSLFEETRNQIRDFITSNNYILNERERSGNNETINFENAKKAFNTNLKNIRLSDIIIAECSYHSNGLGYEVSLALEEKKPVIALYNMSEDRSNPRHIEKVPVSLKGNTSRYLILKEYDLRNIKRTLELAVRDAKDLVDTKFILIIPPEIDRYLEWNARERGVAKAEVTRDAIEAVMRDDKKYQDYLAQNGLGE